MSERPLYEIVFAVIFADIAAQEGVNLDGAFRLIPYEQLTPGDLKDAIDDNILAEFDVPYHPPIEEDEHIYALNFHVAGLANDEIAFKYMMIVEPYARQIYLDHKEFAKPLI